MSSHKTKSGGDFDCLLVSGEEKGVLGLVRLEPTTILPLWAVNQNSNYAQLSFFSSISSPNNNIWL